MLSFLLLLWVLWKPLRSGISEALYWLNEREFRGREQTETSTITGQSHDKMRENGPPSDNEAVCYHSGANFQEPVDFYKI